MNSKPRQRWQDWLLAFGGVWLFISPWVLTTTVDDNASWNAWILGSLVVATAWWALVRPQDTATGWLQGLYGAWLFASPWALGFTGDVNSSWNAWLFGATVVAISAWVLIELAASDNVLSNPTHNNLAHGSH